MGMTNHVDVMVLGAGPGGYVAAIRAAQLGRSVAVVESRWWGGVCLNVGCIPTKALLRNAEVADLVTREGANFGVTGEFSLDYGTGWRRSRRTAETMAKGVRFLMDKNKITAISGWATFTSTHSLAVIGDDGNTTDWTFDDAIIATGAIPKSLPGVEVCGRVMTYEQMIMTDEMPKSLVIAGSGAIGVEFATIASSFGCQVTIVEYLNRLVPSEDPAISAELARAFRKRGITCMTGTAVSSVEDHGDRVTVQVEPAAGGEAREIVADVLLLALGFTPRVTGFGIETIGVALDERGFIGVDDKMRTSVPHIYAVGDVTGKLMLAHVAQAQGTVAAEVIAGLSPRALDYTMLPRATYCEPQIASLGLTREQAEADGHDIVVSRFPFTANGKAQGMGQASGFVMLVADAPSGRLLGVHMIGHGVTELLPELELAITWGITADQIARTVHAHPTLSEAVQQAAQGIGGQSIDA